MSEYLVIESRRMPFAPARMPLPRREPEPKDDAKEKDGERGKGRAG